MMINFIKENKKAFYVYGGMVLIFIVLLMVAVIPQDGTPYNNVALDLGFAQIEGNGVVQLFPK